MVSTSDIEPQTGTAKCPCGKEFSYPKILFGGRQIFTPTLCPECRPKPQEPPRNDSAPAFEDRWRTICPPLYRETDISRLDIPAETIQQVMGWRPTTSKGIGLSGPSGVGKTRLMFALLHRLHLGNVRVRATTAKGFERWVHRMFEKDDDARILIEECRITPVLFLDDLGKEKYTERVESEFYDLIEHRTSHFLPILWTANATGQQLENMLGDDRGTPIVRRLREFSTIISL